MRRNDVSLFDARRDGLAVYAGSLDEIIYAVHSASGHYFWSCANNGLVNPELVMADDVPFAGCYGGAWYPPRA